MLLLTCSSAFAPIKVDLCAALQGLELLSLRNKSPGAGECGCHPLHLSTNKPRCMTWLSRRWAGHPRLSCLAPGRKNKTKQNKENNKVSLDPKRGEEKKKKAHSWSLLINGHKQEGVGCGRGRWKITEGNCTNFCFLSTSRPPELLAVTSLRVNVQGRNVFPFLFSPHGA